MVEGESWRPPNTTIEKLMGFLRGEYSEPVLIELYVGADDKNSSVNILQVSPVVPLIFKAYSNSIFSLNSS